VHGEAGQQGSGGVTIGGAAWLLARARAAVRLTPEEAAEAIGLPVATVEAWEAGAARPTPAELAAASRVYEVNLARLPGLAEGRDVVEALPDGLRVGGRVVPVTWGETPNREVLARYVAAVRAERGVGPDEPVPLRHTDVAALADLLDIDDVALVADVAAVCGCSVADADDVRVRLLRRRLAVTVGDVPLAAAGMVPGVELAVGPAPDADADLTRRSA
jgi:transcriptional regulator with XRE-family HTH domain